MKIFSAPQQVTLNVTNRCNLHCRYCAVASTKNAPGDLSLAQWRRIIAELAELKVFHLLISGGEPFVRKDLIEILEDILRHPFRLSVNTNGTRLDAAVLARLAQTNRLDNIQLSLDGPTAAVHDRIRGAGSFDAMARGIALLQYHGLPFSFFVVVCRNNLGRLSDTVAFCRAAGAARVTVSDLLPIGEARKNLPDLALSFGQQKQAEIELRALKSAYGGFVGGPLIDALGMMDRIAAVPAANAAAEANRITSCDGGISDCSIRPDGTVIPCDRLWDYVVGDLHRASFSEIWRHSTVLQAFRERHALRMDAFSQCRDCGYTAVCRGGCPAIPYNLGAGVHGWDPLSCYKVFVGEKPFYEGLR